MVDVPNLVAYLKQTPIFESGILLCAASSKYQKDVCSKEIGLRAQNMLTTLGSLINIGEEA